MAALWLQETWQTINDELTPLLWSLSLINIYGQIMIPSNGFAVHFLLKPFLHRSFASVAVSLLARALVEYCICKNNYCLAQ